MRRAYVFTFFVLLIMAFGFGLSAQAQQATPATAAQPSARRGQFLYQQNCAPCHGDLGKGEGPVAAQLDVKPTDFTAPIWWPDKTPQQLFDITKEGRIERQMPPWKNRLTDAEIWDAVFYTWSLHTTAEQHNAGEQTYTALCASCHGKDGKGSTGVSDLSGLSSTATRSQKEWEQVLATGKDGHPTFADLKENDRAAVLEYARAFSYRSPFAKIPPGKGIVSGAVTNGTPGGGSVEGITVTLHAFEGNTEGEARTTAADDQGRFRFEGINTDPALTYAVVANYRDLPYASEILAFPDEVTALSLPVEVYETTEDSSGVRIERAHFIIDFEQNNLLMGELYFFSNDKDRTFVGTKNEAGQSVVLRFTLPQGATNLDIDGGVLGARFVETPNGFADTMPLPPGQGSRQVLFRYNLPYSTPSLRLLREINYDVANVNLLVADRGAEVTSPQASLQGTRGTQDATYLNYEGSNLRAGQSLELNFAKLPRAGGSVSTAITNSSTTLVVGLGVGALLMAGLLVYGLVLRKPSPVLATVGESPVAASSGKDVVAQRQRLVAAIARLDDEYEAGKVAEDAYRRRRTKLKGQLLEIARQMQEREPRA
ncbi:MAG: c-type cytochrome [Anaerolineae bacterium]|nr:c-type cytochrome [Anaerolineae bacterium]